MNFCTNTIITGHGGQGVLSSSKLLATYYFKENQDVKTSTLIGLGIRGGGVYSHCKSGEKVHSPLVQAGHADYIIGFEQLETLRWIDYLKPNGHLIVNQAYIQPTTVSSGLQPDFQVDLQSYYSEKTSNIHMVDGYKEISEFENKSVLNSYVLGILAQFEGHSVETWESVFKDCLPSKHCSKNTKAFLKGYQHFQSKKGGQ